VRRSGASFVLVILFLQILSACGLSQPSIQTQMPQIPFTRLSIKPISKLAKVYSRFDFLIEINGLFSNPFDPAQADLIVSLTSPVGNVLQVPAFWYQEFDPQTLEPSGVPGWRARFTPDAPGTWIAQVELVGHGIKSDPLPVAVAANPGARGFLRINPQDPRYFLMDDGSFFFPIGLNIAWANGDVLENYNTWLDHLSQNGGNFIRIWMASWSFGLEWDDTGLGNYTARLKRAWLLDQVLKMAEDRGIYVMLCLINHGAFSETTNSDWTSNPYNIALGGPLKTPEEFVADPTARELFKRRLRYITSRWAAYPSLGAWEWWNEVNWTPITDEALMPWISEMNQELQKFDPYLHLVSTSYATGADKSIWSMDELSFAQEHDYSGKDPITIFPQDRITILKNAGEKPALVGEFGNVSDDPTAAYDKSGIHLHNGLWAAPFSGYAGTAMYWWWDTYIEPAQLWYQYKGISSFLKDENLSNMIPSQVATVPGVASALILSNPEHALVWVRADTYTSHDAQLAFYQSADRGPEWVYSPPVLENLVFTLTGLQDGRYSATWYSTRDGQQEGSPRDVSVVGGSATINVPGLQGDLAVKITKVP